MPGLTQLFTNRGTFKSKKNRISKRGSRYLRTALYQATVAAISKQIHGPKNSIFSAKTKRRQTGKSRNCRNLSQAFTHYFWYVELG
ncbi:transposase [Paenibacillus sp. DMB20]|uniref:transposase n=1 Tax=Paenibacillus sp. DMB20 TaxID=1642570 RepID=UPI0009E4A13B